MFLPIRSKNPPESFPYATCVLIGINILVFALTSNGLVIRRSVVDQFGLKSGDLNVVDVFASMFLHADLLHLLGNLWFLYLLGFAVEGRLRTPKFLLVYFLAGLIGDVFHHLLVGQHNPDLPSLGASGAIMGVLGAALYMFPYAKMTTVYFLSWWWRGIFDCPVWGVALYFLGFDLFYALISSGTGGGVARFAHLGGALGGLLICLILRAHRDCEYTSDAKTTLYETKDLSVLYTPQLEALHRGNPSDSLIVLHWMHRSLKEGRVRPEAQAAFDKMLPQLLAEAPPEVLGSILLQVFDPAKHSPRMLLDLARRVEALPEPQLALRLYELVYGHPQASALDHEACLFRVGMLCEASLGNPHRAVASYRALVEAFPMSPLADSARARLSVLDRSAGGAPQT